MIFFSFWWEEDLFFSVLISIILIEHPRKRAEKRCENITEKHNLIFR